jgi:hypothetical protein
LSFLAASLRVESWQSASPPACPCPTPCLLAGWLAGLLACLLAWLPVKFTATPLLSLPAEPSARASWSCTWTTSQTTSSQPSWRSGAHCLPACFSRLSSWQPPGCFCAVKLRCTPLHSLHTAGSQPGLQPSSCLTNCPLAPPACPPFLPADAPLPPAMPLSSWRCRGSCSGGARHQTSLRGATGSSRPATCSGGCARLNVLMMVEGHAGCHACAQFDAQYIKLPGSVVFDSLLRCTLPLCHLSAVM